MIEKRIYVIVSCYVNGTCNWLIHQPAGRIAAQVAHVVSKMRVDLARKYGNLPITTLILSVPSPDALSEVVHYLRRMSISVYEFEDENREYYDGTAVTAICTEPTSIRPSILQKLPLWYGR